MPRKKRNRAAIHEGDILGISDARGSIPRATPDRSGNPEGIELERDRTTRDLPQGPGATSIDMGAAGEGHAIKPKK